MLWTTEAIRAIHLSLTKGRSSPKGNHLPQFGTDPRMTNTPVLCRKLPGKVHFSIHISQTSWWIQDPWWGVSFQMAPPSAGALRWPSPWPPSHCPSLITTSLGCKRTCQAAISTPQHIAYTYAPTNPTPPHPYPNLIKIGTNSFISLWGYASKQPKFQPDSE